MHQSKIYDIAGAAGVSLATVSRVLNHPEKVSKETYDRVMAIINDRRYVPNSNARNLASKKANSIAIVMPTLFRATNSELVQAIYDRAKKLDYYVRLFLEDFSLSDSQPIEWEDVISSGINGIIFFNDALDKDTIDFIKESPVPIVFANTIAEGNKVSCVIMDYEKSAYEATKWFIEKGYKDILFINTLHYYKTNQLRVSGYKKAMEEAGLKINILETVGNIEKNQKDYAEYLDNHKAPEAVVAVRDSYGISFMNVAYKRGVKVPDDMELIGLQNTRYSLLSNPTVSCVELPAYEIGVKSIDALMKLMENDSISQKIVIPYTFIKRESTKCNH